MALKRLKTKTSKRLKRKLKYKIDKKVREHHRKDRRQAKKTLKGTQKKKLFQIPKSCPFKENVLNFIEEAKKRPKEEQNKQREQICDNETRNISALSDVVDKASIRNNHHDSVQNEPKKEDNKNECKTENNLSLRQYFKEFTKVVNTADVLLEVVDARDPLGTRCFEVEQAVRAASGNKRLVLVLNKADLVPRENLNQWMKYFRRLGPVTIFKASTQDQPKNLGRQKLQQSLKTEGAMKSSVCVGADLLMSMLGNYCRNKGIKTSIRVGVVGVPNVGKSSIINSLTRRKACSVGCTPGVTRVMQEVDLDSKIKLIDCPGIVFTKLSKNDSGPAVLKNIQKVGDVKDPFSVAVNILNRGKKEYFCKLYNISDYETYEELLVKKAARMGKFLKKGIPDIDAAAKSILNDWNTGKIKYYTQPPELTTSDDFHLSAAIVHNEGSEFNIENFESITNALLNEFNDDIETMESTSFAEHKKPILKDPKTTKQVIFENPETRTIKKIKLAERECSAKQDSEMKLQGNQCLNKTLKKQLRKKKRDNLRNVKKVAAIADSLQSFALSARVDGSEGDHNMNKLEL